jgi:hypothetical protein
MNKREVQKSQIIDRGLPFIVVEEGSGLDERIGLPVEVLSVKAQTSPPQVSQGIGPGEYFYRDIEAMRESLEHASGIRSAAMGENPSGVNTYAQLNLMFEADQTKRLPMMRERRDAITRLVEDSVFDIRTYWGDRKQIMLAGDDQRAQAEQFNATRIPTWFIVHEAKGAAKPRSQAAELTKVEQLYNAAVEAQLVQANPQAWIDWYKESLDSGEALPLPHMEADDQTKKAQLENHALLTGSRSSRTTSTRSKCTCRSTVPRRSRRGWRATSWRGRRSKSTSVRTSPVRLVHRAEPGSVRPPCASRDEREHERHLPLRPGVAVPQLKGSRLRWEQSLFQSRSATSPVPARW